MQISRNIWIGLALILLVNCGDDGNSAVKNTATERLFSNQPQLKLPQKISEKANWEWQGQSLDQQWDRIEDQRWLVLRSPEIPLKSFQEVERIDIQLAESSNPAPFSLHWNSEPEFDRQALLRFRYDFRAVQQKPGMRLSLYGHQVSDLDFPGAAMDEVAPRYFFLRLPQQGLAITNVKIFGKGTGLSHHSSSPAYQSFGGQLRQALATDTPVAWSYQTRFAKSIPRELRVGIYLEAGELAHYSIRLTANRGKTSQILTTAALQPSRSWQNLRLEIPPTHGKVTLTFEAKAKGDKARIYWADPTILASLKSKRPNVVVYVMDALRASQLSLYGYKQETDPFLQSIGQQSLVFDQAYATSSWTKPSVATLLTSLYPQTHGVGAFSYSDAMPESVQTLPEYFQTAGYHTAHFSANPLSASLSNLHQGFDVTYTPNAFLEPTEDNKGRKVRADTLNQSIFTWLENHQKQSFFLYVQTMDTHTPYEAPDPPAELLGDGTLQDLYNAEIHANDQALKALVDQLRTLGLLENTLILITADHGESMNERGKAGHGVSVYQEEIHIPLLMYHKDHLPPGRTKKPANLVDLLPTLLDYCDIGFDPTLVQGKNLFQEGGDRTIFSTKFVYPRDEAFRPDDDSEMYAVIQEGWKLIVNQVHEGEPILELYDLIADPKEQNDLAQIQPDKSKKMLAELLKFLGEQQQQRNYFLQTHYDYPWDNHSKEKDQQALSPEDEALLRTLGYIQ